MCSFRYTECTPLQRFSPASNRQAVGRLLTINPGSCSAEVTVNGTDDNGASPGSAITFALKAAPALALEAVQSDSEGDGLRGRMSDATSDWRLTVETGQPVLVENLLVTPTGHPSNVSSVPGWFR